MFARFDRHRTLALAIAMASIAALKFAAVLPLSAADNDEIMNRA
jgi:hypothetical protein